MTRRRATKHDPAREKTSFRTLARDKPVVSKDITGDHQTSSNYVFHVVMLFCFKFSSKIFKPDIIFRPIEQVFLHCFQCL